MPVPRRPIPRPLTLPPRSNIVVLRRTYSSNNAKSGGAASTSGFFYFGNIFAKWSKVAYGSQRGRDHRNRYLLGVPAHICAVGLYCKASRAHLRHARASLATKPRYASLVPKGSLSLTQMPGKYQEYFCQINPQWNRLFSSSCLFLRVFLFLQKILCRINMRCLQNIL